jgi:hypothetical protein
MAVTQLRCEPRAKTTYANARANHHTKKEARRILVISVPQASGSGQGAVPRAAPMPGGLRREGERGRVADDGMVSQRYVGPLHARAAGPGVRLVTSEWCAEDFNGFEDMLYTAAAQAGWLSASGQRQDASGISDADILIRIARRRA